MSETISGSSGEPDATAPQRNPHADSVLRLASAMLRTAWLPALATVVLGALASFALVGWTGSVSALLGGVVAFGSSLLTLWLMRFSAGMNPAFVMALCLGGYIGKMLVLLVVMTLLGAVGFVQREALAFTMLATILVWAGAEIVAFRKTPIPTIVPSE
ncbi:hypothetical protein GCM10027174_18370 [Salinifilum aidingensis]